MTPDELRSLAEISRRATARAEQAQEARDEGIRRALGAGWTHARIAELTGLSRGRIGQVR